MTRTRPSLEQLFFANEGRMVDKWTNYFSIYERHLGRFQGESPNILEIGVSHGGSLDLWRKWFGRGTTILGIDIEPRCLELARRHIRIEIGDQQDPKFLARLVEHYGPFDIVIDDGCHMPGHQIASLNGLWGAVTDGGVYLVEDLHTNYWDEYDGGLRRAGTFIEYAKTIADDTTAFHSRSDDYPRTDWTKSVDGVHFYDSVVVLEKRLHPAPERHQTGRPAFGDMYGAAVEDKLTTEHLAQIAEMTTPKRRIKRALREPGETLRVAKIAARRKLGR